MSSRPRVAVIGAAGFLGGRIAAALADAARRGRAIALPVVGIDSAQGSVRALSWREVDATSPRLADALAGVDVAVWAPASADLQADLSIDPAARRDRLVRTAQALLTTSAAVGVTRIIVVTSAMVYGAAADNPRPLASDAPVRAERDTGVVGDLVAVEEVLARARAKSDGPRVTVLRPAALVGPGVDTVVTRHFEAPRLLTVKGAEPAWQFCHIDDLAAAVRLTITREDLPGVLPVGSPGWLTQEQVERLSGMRRVQLTEASALGTATRLHRLGVLPAPASELAYVMHPWVIAADALVQAGWSPTYDNVTCLGVLLEDVAGHRAVAARRVDRKDAALGAASAAVALVASAALLRRSRRR